ncbi:MAG: hypothetical protein RL404_2816 [Pseudomonadota bacterium]
MKVFSDEALHAKVYVFGRTAFVGLAKLSKHSQDLTEACIKTSDPEIVQETKKFVLDLTGRVTEWRPSEDWHRSARDLG